MRVVLAEDLFLLRDGLVRLLEAYDFEIAAAVESGPELTRALAELTPDVAVVDVRLPPSHTDEGCSARSRPAGTDPGCRCSSSRSTSSSCTRGSCSRTGRAGSGIC
ncbi:hypothetical protein SAV31267_030590 [Streptomyces avermitilis]|uniref:Response regulatory domain-containing protein n=1 Tax=Streptomyces avermitilis TaxID=33903 RepID=A0A4D4MPF6_STRAX|nr:hypothetical protein SAV31267_030590 [Streptomyces avermitilis]